MSAGGVGEEVARRCICEHDAKDHMRPLRLVEQGEGRWLLRLGFCISCSCPKFGPQFGSNGGQAS